MKEIKSWWDPTKQEVIHICCVHMMSYTTHYKMRDMRQN